MYPFHFRFDQLLLSIFFWAVLISCKTAIPQEQNFEITKKIATDKLGTEVEWFPNSTGEYFLFIQKNSSLPATNILKLIIVTQNGDILAEQSFMPGYAKWVTKTSVEVLNVPGTLKENETLVTYKKIIEISSHKNKP